MILLVIDTSGPECAAGLYDAATGQCRAMRSETLGKGHAERLIGMIDEVMAESGLAFAAIGRIGVVVGPGSFTGIRVGVAAARGLALALDIPVVGVSALEVIAEAARPSAGERPVLVAIDAKRDEIYAQCFGADGHALEAAAALSFEAVRALAETHQAVIVGSGAARLAGASEIDADRLALDVIGRIAARLPEKTVARPLYLRGAGAKPQTGFAVAHA